MATKKAEENKIENILTQIEGLTVLELSQLVDAMKEKFDITAVAVGAAPVGGGAQEQQEEKSEYDVVLTDVGGSKLQVLKEVRAITQLGLQDAKALIDNLPGVVKDGVSKEEAEEFKARLEKVGAKVELK